MHHQFIKVLRWILVFWKDLTCCVTLLVWLCAFANNVLPYPLTLKQCSCKFRCHLQIDASYDIYGVTKFMSTIAIFLVPQNHPVLLATPVRQCAEDNKTASPDAPSLVARHIYMDYLYVSTDTLEEAKNLRTILQTVLATGGFNLAKWMYNNLEFNQSIPESDRSISAPVNTNKKDFDRVLGVKWNPINDCYLLQPTNFQDTPKKLTQRTLLKYVSSFFDPFGSSSPIQIRVRTSLQQIWKDNQHWDCPIALQAHPELKNVFEVVANLSTVHIKRHYFEASKQPIHKELLVFNDASEKAIANVVFLRTVSSDKSVSLSFILGKARVAPIKRMTTAISNFWLQRTELNWLNSWKKNKTFLSTQLYIGQTALQFYLGSTHPRADTKFS